MEAIDKLYGIPIVERGVDMTRNVYQRIKVSDFVVIMNILNVLSNKICYIGMKFA